MPRKPIGGFARPIQVSLFIRDYLADGTETWAFNLYKAYKEEVQAQRRNIDTGRMEYVYPYKRKNLQNVRRKVCSYGSFRTYLYKARQLGLIEYVDPGSHDTQPMTKGGEYAQRADESFYLERLLYFRAVLDHLNDSAWQNLQAAMGYKT